MLQTNGFSEDKLRIKCSQYMIEHTDELIPFLLSQDKHPFLQNANAIKDWHFATLYVKHPKPAQNYIYQQREQ